MDGDRAGAAWITITTRRLRHGIRALRVHRRRQLAPRARAPPPSPSPAHRDDHAGGGAAATAALHVRAVTHGGLGGRHRVTETHRVETQAGCTWTAQSQVAWITITAAHQPRARATSASPCAPFGLRRRTGTLPWRARRVTMTQAGARHESASSTVSMPSAPPRDARRASSVSLLVAADARRGAGHAHRHPVVPADQPADSDRRLREGRRGGAGRRATR